MRNFLIILVLTGGLVFLAALVWGLVTNNVETPPYEVVESEGQIEIRQYGSMIVAEADVEGEREDAIGDGFRVIADYIFGNNLASENVAMTAPVTQQANQTIAMTAPVTQKSDGTTWKVRFVMPSEYTMAALPQPVNPEVQLIEVPSSRFVAIQFSGFGNQASLDEHTEQLLAFLEREGLRPIGQPTYAFYNAPWTLPFMRRNEVMIEIGN